MCHRLSCGRALGRGQVWSWQSWMGALPIVTEARGIRQPHVPINGSVPGFQEKGLTAALQHILLSQLTHGTKMVLTYPTGARN